MGGLLDRLSAFSIQSILILSLMLTGFYFLGLYDDGSELEAVTNKVKGEILEQQKTEKESDMALEDIEQVRLAYGALSEQFKLVSAQLPSTIEQTEILNIVDQISKQSGLTVKRKEWRDLRKDGTVIETLPMKIMGEGTYPEIITFVNRVAEIERLVSTGALSIVGPRGGGQGNRSQMEMELRVHRYKADNDTTKETEKKK